MSAALILPVLGIIRRNEKAMSNVAAQHVRGRSRFARKALDRILAGSTAFALVIGALVAGEWAGEIVPEAKASITGGDPVSRQGIKPEWTSLKDWRAVWQHPLDDHSFYWGSDSANAPSALNGQTNILWQSYDFSDDLTTYKTRAVLALKRTSSTGEAAFDRQQFETLAVGRIGGTRKDPSAPLTIYMWDNDARRNSAVARCENNYTPVVRITSGDEFVYWACMPGMRNDGGFSPNIGNSAAVGGEVDQYTGNLYVASGVLGNADNQGNSSRAANTAGQWTFTVWNPETGEYSMSGSVQPGDWVSGMSTVPKERLKIRQNVSGSGDRDPSAPADFALDADGNVYTYTGGGVSSTSSGNMSLVRMEPARNENGDIIDGKENTPWRYYVVSKINKDPAYPTQYWDDGGWIFGNAILEGQLFLAASNRVSNIPTVAPATARTGPEGTTAIVKVDPMSATAKIVWSVDNIDLPSGESRDNASPQQAETIRGVLYHDLNGDGQISGTEKGIAGQTVALYNADGKLLSTQETDSTGRYSFIVTGTDSTVYYVRPVQVKVPLSDGTMVNAVQTWGAGSVETGYDSTGAPKVNTAEVMCLTGASTQEAGMACLGPKDPSFPDTIGSLGTFSTPSDWLSYARFTMNTSQKVPTADFGFSAFGSYGDAAAGPSAAGVPYHNNLYSPSVWLGGTLGGYTGPATDNTAHNIGEGGTDDGVSIVSYTGAIPLQGTTLSATKQYDLSAQISGPLADQAIVKGWVTGAGNNTWNTTAKWTPQNTDGTATGTFKFQESGVVSGTPTVQFRADATTAQVSVPTNSSGSYYALPGGSTSWITSGEIEDYTVTLADGVIRPAAKTTGGSGTFQVAGKWITAGTTSGIAPASGVSSGANTTVTASVPNNNWTIVGVTVKDTKTGDTVMVPQVSLPASSVSFVYQAGLGSDVIVEVTYARIPDPEKSRLSLDATSVQVGQNITATVTVKDADQVNMPGVLVTFANASDPDTTITGLNGTKTCVTGEDGTCSVTVTSTKAKTYLNEISATLNLSGQDKPVANSPQTVTFTPKLMSHTTSTFTVSPVVNALDQNQTDWRIADGTSAYTGILTALDDYSNPVLNLNTADIVFSASSSTVAITSVINNGDGTYAVSFTSKVAGTPTASVAYQNTKVGQDRPIPFKPGDAVVGPVQCEDPSRTGTNVSADPTNLRVGGTSTVTALVTDAKCNPIPGVTVGFTSNGSGSLSDQAKQTDANGKAIVTLTDAVAETVSVTATVSAGALYKSPVQITFTTGDFSVERSEFTVSPQASLTNTSTWMVANGVAAYTGTLVARDGQGNALKNLSVSDIAFSASNSAVAISGVTANNDGTYTVSFTSAVASKNFTASVRYKGAQVGPDRPIPFKAGPAVVGPIICTDPTKVGTSLTASPDSLPVGDISSVVAVVTDASCNPVPGTNVVFTLDSGPTGILLVTNAVTDDDGKAYATVTDTTAGTVKVHAKFSAGEISNSPVGITFTVGGFSWTESRFTVSPVVDPASNSQSGWKTADGVSSYTGVLAARDENGNPLTGLATDDIVFTSTSGAVVVSGVSTSGDGSYSVSFTSTVADSTPTASVAYKQTKVGQNKPIPFKAGEAVVGPIACADGKTGTAMSASPTQLGVGGSSTVTVLVTDAKCNPVPGVSVVLKSTGSGVLSSGVKSTDASGKVEVTLTDEVAETVKVSAEIPAGEVWGSAVPVTFTAGGFSWERSSFNVTPEVNLTDSSGWLTANGTSAYKGVFTARDGLGNALTGLTIGDIAFSSSASTVVISNVTNNGDGTYSVFFTSTVATSSSTASVRYQGTQVGWSKPVPFKAGDPVLGPIVCSDPTKAGTSLAASPTVLGVGGESTVTALVTDSNCNPVQGVSVQVSVTNSGSLNPSSGTTDANGLLKVKLTDNVAETVNVSATIPQGTIGGPQVSVKFTEGGFSAAMSTFTVSPSANVSNTSTWVVANGIAAYTATLTAKDEKGNPLKTLATTDMAFTSTSASVAVSGVTNNNDGTYSVSFTSTVADSLAMAGMKYQGTQIGVSKPIPFKAGDPVLGPIVCADPAKVGTSITASPTILGVGGQSAVTVVVTDANCNPVSGVSVQLAATGSGTLSQTLGSTDTTGRFGSTLTDNVAETVGVSATIPAGTVSNSPANVTFTEGGFSAEHSSFTVNPAANLTNPSTWVTADGIGAYTGTLTAKDEKGNPLKTLAVADIVFSASSAKVTISGVTNNNDGTYTVSFTSKAADPAVTAGVAYQNTTIGTAKPIPFKAGEPVLGPIVCTDPTKSGTNVSAAPALLGVGGQSTITVLVTDANCNPVAGISVLVETSGSAVLSAESGSTDANGKFIVTLSDDTAETVEVSAAIPGGAVAKSPVSVKFTEGGFSAAQSTFTVSPAANLANPSTWVVANGIATYTGTLTAKDEKGNPLNNLAVADIVISASTASVTISAVTNNNNGTYTVTFTSKVADSAVTASAAYQGAAIDTAKPIPFRAGDSVAGPVVCADPAKSGTKVWASPEQLGVGGESSVTVLVTDANCNPVQGTTVQLTASGSGTLSVASGSTDSNGLFVAKLSDDVAEVVEVTAKIPAGTVWGSPAKVKFTEGGFSAKQSTFTVSPVANPDNASAWVVADGTSAYTGTLTAKDEKGNLLGNLTVTDIVFSASTANVTVSSVTNNNNGTYTVRFTSKVADPSVTASAKYQGSPVGTTKPIPFKAGDVVLGPIDCADPGKTGTSIWANPTVLGVGGQSAVTVLVTDSNCNPVSGVKVGLTTTGSSVLSAASDTTDANGRVQVKLTDDTAETAYVTATIPAGKVSGSPVSVKFEEGGFSATKSTFAVTPVANTANSSTWVVADGSSAYTGTFTAMDDKGNPLKTLAASDIVFSASRSFVKISNVVNNNDGTYTVAFTSTVADAAPTASVKYQGTQVGQDKPVPFTSGAPVVGPITCTDPSKTGTSVSASPTTLGVGGSSTITAIVTDESCNPVAGAAVTLSVTGSGKLSLASGNTDANGRLEAKLTDDVAETVNVTARIPAGQVSGSPVPVTFTVGGFSWDESSFAVSPAADLTNESTWVVANGTSRYTGTLTARDEKGNPLTGLDVNAIVFTASSPAVVKSSVKNNNDGTYTVWFTSTQASASVTASAAYQGAKIGTNLPIPFRSGDPVTGPVLCETGTGTNLTATPRTLTVGASSTVTALVTDSLCNPVSGIQVSFTASGSGELAASSIATDANGRATVKLTDNVAETVNVKARIPGGEITGSPVAVTFTVDEFAWTESSFAVSPAANPADSSTWRVADGTQSYVGTLTARDGKGNALTGLDIADIKFSVSSSSVRVTSVANNGNGTYSVSFSSAVADSTPMASVKFQGTQVGADTPVPFRPGDVVTGPVTCSDGRTGTSVWASPTDLGVGGQSTLTAIVTDASCNPVPGVQVSFAVSGSAALSATSKATDSTGRVQVNLSDDVAETVRVSARIPSGEVSGSPVGVTFREGTFSWSRSSFAVSPTADPANRATWVIADGVSHYVGTLTARDDKANPLTGLDVAHMVFASTSARVSVSEVVAHNNGTYTVNFASTVADAAPKASVRYQGTQIGGNEPIPFTFDAPVVGPVVCTEGKTGTSVSASPTELGVGGTSTITATVTDSLCNPVPGTLVTLSVSGSGVLSAASGTTDANGRVQVTLSDNVAETVRVSAHIPQGGLSGSPVAVTFLVGGFSHERSSFTVSPVPDPMNTATWAVADGVSRYVGTLTIRDEKDNPITGLDPADIAFTASSGHVSVTRVTANANGSYTVAFTSTVADASATASVRYQGTQVGGNEPIPFASGAPVVGPVTCEDGQLGTRVWANPTQVAAGGTSTVTVQVTDALCNPVPGVSVNLTASGSAALSPTSGTTDANGRLTASLTDDVAHTVAVTARIFAGTVSGSPAFVKFTEGGFSWGETSFTVSPAVNMSNESTWVIANGIDDYVATLTAKDAKGNLLANLDVADMKFSASRSFVAISPVRNNGDGTYSVSLTSAVANASLTAKVEYQGVQVGGAKPIPFRAGAAVVGPILCSDPSAVGTSVWAAPSELGVGGTSVITAIVTDSWCNPVSGVQVDLTATGSGVLSANSKVTDANGRVQVTLSDDVAETVSVAAKIPAGPVSGSPAKVKFSVGGFSWDRTSFTVSPAANLNNEASWVVADGVSRYTATLTAQDEKGNALTSLDVNDIVISASSPVIVKSRVTNNNDGTYSATFTSTQAGASFTASAAYQGAQVGASKPIPFRAGAPVVGPVVCEQGMGTSAWANPSELAAGGTSTITAIVTDALCNPVSGIEVGFAASGSGVLSAVSRTTDASGRVQVSLTDDVAQSVRVTVTTPAGEMSASPVRVRFTEGVFSATSSTFTLTPAVDLTDAATWVAADGRAAYKGIMTAKDERGNPITNLVLDDIEFRVTSAAVATSQVVNHGNGTYSVSFTSAVADSAPMASLYYRDVQIGQARPVPFTSTEPVVGPVKCTDPSKTGTSLVVDPAELGVGGVSTVTAIVTDSSCNPVPWHRVEFTATGSGVLTTDSAYTDRNGRAQVRLSDDTAETVFVRAQIAAGQISGSPASVRFTEGSLDLMRSAFTLTPTDSSAWSVAADGVQSWTGRFIAKDSKGNPLVNLDPAHMGFTVAPSGVTKSGVAHRGDGVYEVRFTSTTAGDFTADMAYQGTPVASKRPLAFVAGAVDRFSSQVSVSPSTQAAGAPVMVTVKVVDQNGNPVIGLTPADIRVRATSAELPDMTVSGFQETSPGVYSFPATSWVAGQYQVVATVRGEQLAAKPLVVFTSGGVCVSNCTPADPQFVTRFEMKDNDQLADGRSRDSAVAYAFDAYGNPVAGAKVVVTDKTANPATGALSPATQTVTTGEDGTARIYWTSTTAGIFTAEGTIDGLRPTTGVMNQIRFTSGQADPGHSWLKVTPSSPIRVGNSYTATVTAKDGSGNPVSDAVVAFRLDPASGAQLSQPTCVTDPAGACQVQVSSIVATETALHATLPRNGMPTDIGGSDPVTASPQTVRFIAEQACVVNCTPSDPTRVTRVEVVDDGAQANGSASNLAKVFVFDRFGNPVPGASVVSTTSDPGLRIVTPIPATGADGTTLIEFRSTVAGGHQARVMVERMVPGQAISSDGTRTDDGSITLNFSSGSADLSQSGLTIDPSTAQVVGSRFAVTAHLRDAQGNPVHNGVVSFPGAGPVQFSASSCLTDAGGVCSVTATSTVAGRFVIEARSGAAPLGTSVTAVFTPDEICAGGCVPVDPGHATRAVVTQDGRLADGIQRNQVTVFAFDRYGNPAVGAQVQSWSSAGVLAIQSDPAPIGADGTTTIWYTSATAGAHTAEVKVAGLVPAGSPVALHFSNGHADPARSGWTITPQGPLTVGEGADNTYTATASVKDAQGNPVGQAVAVFSVTPAGPSMTPASSCVTNDQGLCSVKIFSVTSGTHTVTASVAGSAILNTGTGSASASIAWAADGVCSPSRGCQPVDPNLPESRRTHVEVSVNDQTANGTAKDIVTVWAFDRWGNPAEGALVQAESSNSGLRIQSGIAPIGRDGTSTIWFTSTVPGQYPAQISVDGTSLPDSPVTLRFRAGEVCVIEAGCEPTGPARDPQRQTRVEVTLNDQPVSGQDVITVFAFDANGNPVANAAIRLVPQEPDLDLGAGPGREVTAVTDDSGVAIVLASGSGGKAYHVRAFVGATELSEHGSTLTLRFLTVPSITSPVDGGASKGEMTIEGVGQSPGNTVTVRDGDTVVCTTKVGEDGKWSCTVSLPEGNHSLSAVETTPDGKSSTGSDPIVITVDDTPPRNPVLNLSRGDEITGRADPDSTITVTDENGDPVSGCENVKPDSSGKFSCRPAPPLEPGSTVRVTAKDPAGNESGQVTLRIQKLEIEIAYPERHPLETQVATGHGFRPGEEVCLVLDGNPAMFGCHKADADGKVTFVFTIPSDVQPGTHQITLSSESGSISVPFEVTGALAIRTGGSSSTPQSIALRGVVAGLVAATVGVWVGALHRRIRRSHSSPNRPFMW